MLEIEQYMDKVIHEFIQSVKSEHIRIYVTYDIYQKLSELGLIILNDTQYGQYEAQYKGHRIDVDTSMSDDIRLQYETISNSFKVGA